MYKEGRKGTKGTNRPSIIFVPFCLKEVQVILSNDIFVLFSVCSKRD
jgi:hypothetical protein